MKPTGDEREELAERAYREDVQRRLDDEVEAAALADAFSEGARAGLMGFGASLNPWQSNTREHAEWERGRMSTLAQFLGRRAA